MIQILLGLGLAFIIAAWFGKRARGVVGGHEPDGDLLNRVAAVQQQQQAKHHGEFRVRVCRTNTDTGPHIGKLNTFLMFPKSQAPM